MSGCAIECRINAEDPFYEFAPSTGIVPNCNIPSGPGVRVDTYLYPGCNVSGYYDSLIAKLITYGGDFNEARVRMKNALSEFTRSEEHTSELQSRQYLVCRLLLEKKNTIA